MPRDLATLANALRWQATPVEKRLWHWPRKRPRGFKFRRQVVLGPYIVDFASYEARLVIEVDGEFHADQPRDVIRQAWLEADGWEVARYWNREVRFALEDVLVDVEPSLRDARRGAAAGLRPGQCNAWPAGRPGQSNNSASFVTGWLPFSCWTRSMASSFVGHNAKEGPPGPGTQHASTRSRGPAAIAAGPAFIRARDTPPPP